MYVFVCVFFFENLKKPDQYYMQDQPTVNNNLNNSNKIISCCTVLVTEYRYSVAHSAYSQEHKEIAQTQTHTHTHIDARCLPTNITNITNITNTTSTTSAA